jgi:hypothetical protein
MARELWRFGEVMTENWVFFSVFFGLQLSIFWFCGMAFCAGFLFFS